MGRGTLPPPPDHVFMFTLLSNSLQRMKEVLAMYPTKQLHHYRVPYMYVGPFMLLFTHVSVN